MQPWELHPPLRGDFGGHLNAAPVERGRVRLERSNGSDFVAPLFGSNYLIPELLFGEGFGGGIVFALEFGLVLGFVIDRASASDDGSTCHAEQREGSESWHEDGGRDCSAEC